MMIEIVVSRQFCFNCILLMTSHTVSVHLRLRLKIVKMTTSFRLYLRMYSSTDSVIVLFTNKHDRIIADAIAEKRTSTITGRSS
jgi:hypothetical protein